MSGVDSPNRHRLRRGLVWVLTALAAISLVAFVIVFWVHQVALNTDRFESLVAPLVADPAVVGALSEAISLQVVDALDVQALLVQSLPGRLDLLAAPLTVAAQDLVRRQLTALMSDAAFPRVWGSATRRVHSLLVRTVRDDPRNPSVSSSGGNVTLDLLGLAGSVLQTRQAAGDSPSGLIPDMAPEETRRRLTEALGIQVPEDFGQVTLLQSTQLAAAQRAVRLLDRSVLAVLGLALAFTGAALALSLDRRRTMLALGVSTVVLTVLVVLMLPYVIGSAVSQVSAGPGQVIAAAVLALAQASLLGFLALIVWLGVLAAMVAHLAGRPRWLRQANAAVGRALSG